MTRKTFNLADAVKSAKAHVDNLRIRIEELKEKRDQAQNAPLPLDELAPKIERWIEAKASAFRTGINLSGLLNPNARGADLTLEVKGEPVLVGTSYASLPQLDGLACALMPEKVRELLLSIVAERLKDVETIPANERRKRIEKIEQELLAAEIEEESAITELEAAGFDLSRRPDADPRAVLAVKD